MPRITIDGKECEFDGKKTVLQVALDSDIEIPHYCYHPSLSIVASCRICLAEVAQPNPHNEGKLELVPKLLPTCQTPAADGMEVYTQSPKSIANQKAVMEYLLVNHPLDCPVCDQAGECYLQDYSYRYGRAGSRFVEDKIKQPKKDVGDHVLLYADRCIMCTRCVRFTREVTGTGELATFGRGAEEQIDIFPGRPVNNELSGNVIDLCPVGALLDKDFLFAQRVWLLKEAPSIDGITAGGDNIWIHHNEGRIYRIKPRTNLEVNQWWISDEVRYGWKFIHSDARLTQPRRMNMGVQVDIDWPRAIEAATTLLRKTVQEKGEGSLALMVSPMLTCEEAHLLGRFILGIDPKAVLAMGPVPVHGEDKTFPGGYTVHAEKCPNRRGVRRVLEALSGDADRILDFDAFVAGLGEKGSPTAAMLLTGNYPSEWVTKELTAACRRRQVVLLDTLQSGLSDAAEVLLPSVTWAEKGGTFENIHGRLQSFEAAIAPIEFAQPEGQTALDLLAAAELSEPARFDGEAIRRQMGEPFTSDVYHPVTREPARETMSYVEL